MKDQPVKDQIRFIHVPCFPRGIPIRLVSSDDDPVGVIMSHGCPITIAYEWVQDVIQDVSEKRVNHLNIGIAYCSPTEKNYSRKQGNKIASERLSKNPLVFWPVTSVNIEHVEVVVADIAKAVLDAVSMPSRWVVVEWIAGVEADLKKSKMETNFGSFEILSRKKPGSWAGSPPGWFLRYYDATLFNSKRDGSST